MELNKNNIEALNILIQIVEKNKMFYSLSRDLVEYIHFGAVNNLIEPDYGIILNPNDYFKLKLMYPENFYDNSDLLNGELCPVFINNENAINIYLFVPTNNKKYNQFLRKIDRNNYIFVLKNKDKFNKWTIFKSMIIKGLKFLYKESNLKVLINSLLEYEYTNFAYVHAYMQATKNNLYTNISFKTDMCNFNNFDYKYCVEFKKKAD
ncbi:Uncharacterised protein [Mycoplasmopsis californica]|uniref:Uncharacterized protein n=1 Tax=Mycoplasmopsis equigenitalium TaxID=114883 RepID=A0ABY5J132_9BACT|nr:hypothetical protein [Mycoplasmopsis equigenitalium]UUD36958.1 hypothetical protein NPA09_00025 [Mycoplasmopsis equigenitalium]VEU69747.1 Uncharacterised protein [Mycoplasmopsis californica]